MRVTTRLACRHRRRAARFIMTATNAVSYTTPRDMIRMSASKANAATIGDQCHVAEGSFASFVARSHEV